MTTCLERAVHLVWTTAPCTGDLTVHRQPEGDWVISLTGVFTGTKPATDLLGLEVLSAYFAKLGLPFVVQPLVRAGVIEQVTIPLAAKDVASGEQAVRRVLP